MPMFSYEPSVKLNPRWQASQAAYLRIIGQCLMDQATDITLYSATVVPVAALQHAVQPPRKVVQQPLLARPHHLFQQSSGQIIARPNFLLHPAE